MFTSRTVVFTATANKFAPIMPPPMSIFSDGQLQARVQSGAIVGVRRVITFSTDRRSSEGRGLDLTWRTSVKPRRPRRKPRQRNLLRQDRPVEVPRRQAPRQRQVMLRRPR